MRRFHLASTSRVWAITLNFVEKLDHIRWFRRWWNRVRVVVEYTTIVS